MIRNSLRGLAVDEKSTSPQYIHPSAADPKRIESEIITSCILLPTVCYCTAFKLVICFSGLVSKINFCSKYRISIDKLSGSITHQYTTLMVGVSAKLTCPWPGDFLDHLPWAPGLMLGLLLLLLDLLSQLLHRSHRGLSCQIRR